MLRKLLEFVASGRSHDDGAEATEYTVATEAFGRVGTFDPSGDTTVRTAYYRLRLKLGQYYESEGKDDDVVIGIPKGHYSLEFTRREPGVPASRLGERAFEEAPAPEPRPNRTRRLMLAALALAVFVTGVAVGWEWHKSQSLSPGDAVRDDVLTSFWRSFAGADRAVLVTFANAEMLHTESGDLLKFEGGAVDARGAKVEQSVARGAVGSPELLGKHSLFYEDGYSGTGEVHAMYHLTRLLSTTGIEMQIKRSRMIGSEDLKNHNVVLLGGGRENLAVDDYRLKQGYVFDAPRHIMWSNSIRDTKGMLPGGRASYTVERDPKSGVMKTDYAIFSVIPSLTPNRKIMILAGLTTSGTQGAAEFATMDGRHIAALLAQMAATTQKHLTTLPPYFESILEVQVVRGLDPVWVQCVAARPIE